MTEIQDLRQVGLDLRQQIFHHSLHRKLVKHGGELIRLFVWKKFNVCVYKSSMIRPGLGSELLSVGDPLLLQGLQDKIDTSFQMFDCDILLDNTQNSGDVSSSHSELRQFDIEELVEIVSSVFPGNFVLKRLTY